MSWLLEFALMIAVCVVGYYATFAGIVIALIVWDILTGSTDETKGHTKP